MKVSASTRPRIIPTTRAAAHPTKSPPKNTKRNCTPPKTMASFVMTPASRMPVRIRDNTMAVASLKRLSPSTRIVSRFGAPSWRKSAITDTGSVALRIDPRRSPSSQPNGVATTRIPAMRPVEISRPGTASVRTAVRLSRSARASRLKADSKISVGRKTKNAISGAIRRLAIGSRMSPPRCASCASAIPVSTNATENGILIRLETAITPPATSRSPTVAPTISMT